MAEPARTIERDIKPIPGAGALSRLILASLARETPHDDGLHSALSQDEVCVFEPSARFRVYVFTAKVADRIHP